MKTAGTTTVEIRSIVDGGVMNHKRACHAKILTSADNTVGIRYEIEASGDHYLIHLAVE